MHGLSAEVVRKSQYSAVSKIKISLQKWCTTGKHLQTNICILQLKLAFMILIWIHTGQNTIISMIDNSYVQTVPNHRRLLIIDDKSLPHKQWRAFTRLLIFKINFSS